MGKCECINVGNVPGSLSLYRDTLPVEGKYTGNNDNEHKETDGRLLLDRTQPGIAITRIECTMCHCCWCKAQRAQRWNQ